MMSKTNGKKTLNRPHRKHTKMKKRKEINKKEKRQHV